MKYLISDTIFKSNIDFPQLLTSDTRDENIVFTVEDSKSIYQQRYEPFRNIYLPNHQLWLSIGKYNNEYLLKFPGTCDFLISPNNNSISCIRNECSINTLQYIFLNHVIPLYLSSTRSFLLHCSAVNINGYAYLFIGDSTSGKSTLAACLCNNGYELLSDDFLLIRAYKSAFHAVPSYPSLRLHRDSIAKVLGYEPPEFNSDIFEYKKWIKANSNKLKYSFGETIIKSIYLLTNSARCGNNSELQVLKPSESLVGLLNNSFVIDSTNRELLSFNMDFCARLVEKVQVSKLVFKKDFKELENVLNIILTQSNQ